MRKNTKRIKDDSKRRRYRRKLSNRLKIYGTKERPRLCIVRSNAHLTAQVINDDESKTVCSAATFGKTTEEKAKKSAEGAKIFGIKLAEMMKSKGITKVVFDRNGRTYGKILAEIADSVRKNGITV